MPALRFASVRAEDHMDWRGPWDKLRDGLTDQSPVAAGFCRSLRTIRGNICAPWRGGAAPETQRLTDWARATRTSCQLSCSNSSAKRGGRGTTLRAVSTTAPQLTRICPMGKRSSACTAAG